MAKLTDRQKTNIIAKYKTGAYTNIQLAKSYKISESMVRKLCDGIGKENAHIVEAQTNLEIAKKCDLSAIENLAINQAVKYKLDSMEYKEKNIRSVHEVASEILDGIRKSVQNGKVQKVVTEGVGKGYTQATIIETDYQPEHYEKAGNTVYKVAQTLGVVDNSTKVAIQNNNSNKEDDVIEWV